MKGCNECLKQAVNKIDDLCTATSEPSLIPSGLYSIDRGLKGLRSGRLAAIRSADYLYSSALAYQYILSSISNGDTAIVFTSSSSDEVVMRLLSMLEYIEYEKLYSGTLEDDDWSKLNQAASHLKDSGLYINDDSASISDIEARLNEFLNENNKPEKKNAQFDRKGFDVENPAKLILIDSLQAFSPSSEEGVNDALSAMRKMATHYNVSIIILDDNRKASFNNLEKYDHAIKRYAQDYIDIDSNRRFPHDRMQLHICAISNDTYSDHLLSAMFVSKYLSLQAWDNKNKGDY